MKPWQTPFNKAPNKGRERRKDKRAESKEQKKKTTYTAQWVTKGQRKNHFIFLHIIILLYSWLPTGTYYKILVFWNFFFLLSLSLSLQIW
jgi:hypothetical protein